MEEPSAMVEVPGELLPAMKDGCPGAGICGCERESGLASMPICFLVKEHAKSVVAIQDLQKRMVQVESIQDDVLDAVSEIHGFLSNSIRTSSVNLSVPSRGSGSSFSTFNKSSSLRPRRFSYSLSPLKETTDVPLTTPRKRSFSLWDLTREGKKEVPSVITEQAETQKLIDLAKTKESALESDKQDSGLDSDCRDQNDPQASLNRHITNWPRHESKDELMHLLEEIGNKSEELQQQLSGAEENSVLSNLMEEVSKLQADRQGLHHYICDVEKERDLLETKLNYLEVSSQEITSEKQELQTKLLSTLVATHDLTNAEDGPSSALARHTLVASPGSQPSSALNVKKSASKIDSNLVSAVLKETNVVDLQRQVLYYLVKNAVLQTKLSDSDQGHVSRATESAQMENMLKEENRQLMKENRELRIGLDEQRLESDALKSKVAMLERILHSLSVENRELNWHLEETYHQRDTKNTRQNFSSSFTYGSSSAKPSLGKRSSLPAQFSQTRDAYVSCNKTKLLPNTSSFLNVTIDEQEEYPPLKHGNISGFDNYSAPLGASTPAALPLQKQLRFSSVVNASPVLPNTPSVSHYQAMRKRLKSGDKDHARTSKNVNDNHTGVQESTNKGPSLLAKNLPLESTNPFPFSTILEKLKANSEFRMSKKIGSDQSGETFNGMNSQKGSLSYAKAKGSGTLECESVCQRNQSSSKEDSSVRKTSGTSRNIHQRIQDILDRITAESDENGT